MYIPKYFEMSQKSIFPFIKENPFAILVSENKDEIIATHLPLLLSEDSKFLYGHLALPNPQKESDNKKVLCIFSGPHAYISPSWYETNRSVPTWNYLAVHITGNLRVVRDQKKIQENLNRLIQTFESSQSSYQIEEVDPDYLKGLEKGIVSFEIEILNIQGKQKLSQNHSKERQQLVISNLEKIEKENEISIAKLMRNNLNQAE